MVIHTQRFGHNSGKSYVHRLPAETAREWLDSMVQSIEAAKTSDTRKKIEAAQGKGRFSAYRFWCKRMFDSDVFQFFIAFLIIFCFFMDLAEAQLLPEPGSKMERDFFALEISTTVLFTLELAVNAFAHSKNRFAAFIARRANWVDSGIVLMSICSVILAAADVQLPNAKLLRLMRLGRIIRIFKSLKNLQKILSATASSVLPVCNAFFILLIISSVYAVLGTNFFRHRSPEFFSDFLTALFTMFQVLAGTPGPPACQEASSRTAKRRQTSPSFSSATC